MKPKRPRLKLRIESRETRQSRSVRFTPSEEIQIQKAADRYCDGDFSDWVRYSALNFVPEKEDLEWTKDSA